MGSNTGSSVNVTAGAAGSFVLTVTATNGGCNAIRTTTVTVLARPVFTISGPASVCAAGTATYTGVSTPPGASYTWSVSGNAQIVSSDLLSVTVNATGVGTFTVNAVASQNGCKESLSRTVTVAGVTTATVPTALTLCAGDRGCFRTVASGTPPFEFTWRHGTTVLASGGNILVTNRASTSELCIGPITAADAGAYTVTVTGACGPAVTRSTSLTLSNIFSCPSFVSVNNVSLLEGTTIPRSAAFTLSLSKALALPVSVNWATATGTVSIGRDPVTGALLTISSTSTPGTCGSLQLSDFTPSGGTVNFPAGTTTRTVSVPICPDVLIEKNETFFVLLSRPINADLVPFNVGIGTIQNDDGSTGSFDLAPSDADVGVGPQERLAYDFSWTVPAPLDWHDLRSLELRIRDLEGTILHVLFDEGAGTFALVDDRSGRLGPAFPAGSANRLETEAARVYLAESRIQGSGPTGPSVTLHLSLGFKPQAEGRTYLVEVVATDDSGDSQEFTPAGSLTVEGAHGARGSLPETVQRLEDGRGEAAGPEGLESAPQQLSLSAAPNPARSGPISIRYALPSDLAGSPVQLDIFDVSGRLVRSLVSGQTQEAGVHQLTWDLRDDVGRASGHGIFLCRLRAGGQERMRKLMVLAE